MAASEKTAGRAGPGDRRHRGGAVRSGRGTSFALRACDGGVLTNAPLCVTIGNRQQRKQRKGIWQST